MTAQTSHYLVWFRSNSTSKTMIAAGTKNEAIAIFAARHDCIPSGYIAVRKVTSA